jgi:hypothetical protein
MDCVFFYKYSNDNFFMRCVGVNEVVKSFTHGSFSRLQIKKALIK